MIGSGHMHKLGNFVDDKGYVGAGYGSILKGTHHTSIKMRVFKGRAIMYGERN
jgi:hypothetical protein